MFQFQVLLSAAGLLTEIAILVMTILFMSRTGRNDAKFLFIGSLVHVLVRITYLVIPTMSFFQYDSDNAYDITRFYNVMGFVSFFGAVFFCVGMVMLIQSTINSHTKGHPN